VTLTFNQNVSASLSSGDLIAQNLAGGAVIAATLVSYDPATDAAVFNFAGKLADGNYRATLGKAGLADEFGNAMAADFSMDFFIYAGDANHDRGVGFADLVAVAQNYGKASVTTYAQGDFNYDGKVDFADLVAVAQKYGTTLPPPPPGALPIAASLPEMPVVSNNANIVKTLLVTYRATKCIATKLKPVRRR